LRELATLRVERRIAHALRRLAEQSESGQTNNGREEKSGGTTIDFPLPRQDVADMCGATLHTVSRVLTTWEKAGWITTNRQRVTILDFAAIQGIAVDEAP